MTAGEWTEPAPEDTTLRPGFCVLCRFEVEADDVVVNYGERCICLRCYLRETGTDMRMSKTLRRQVMSVLDGVR